MKEVSIFSKLEKQSILFPKLSNYSAYSFHFKGVYFQFKVKMFPWGCTNNHLKSATLTFTNYKMRNIKSMLVHGINSVTKTLIKIKCATKKQRRKVQQKDHSNKLN